MPVIYDGPNGRVYMGFLGGFSVETPRNPVKRKLPPWLKSRVTFLWDSLRYHGFDASRDADAAQVLWGYAIESMDYGALGQAAALDEPVDVVLSGMLADLRAHRKK